MKSEIIIRPIAAEDNAAIAAIIRKSLEEFNAAKPGTVYFDKTTDFLYELFTQDFSAYFIAEEGNKILGGAGIYPTEGLPKNTCELVKMYLSKEARGKGLGRTLLQKCVSEAKKIGYKQMYLESMPELKTAISMYNNSGFNNVGHPLGNSVHNGCSVWMIKDL